MNKKTTKLLISILVLLGVLGFNFIKGQLNDSKGSNTLPPTSSVSKEVDDSASANTPVDENKVEKKDTSSGDNKSSNENEVNEESSNSADERKSDKGTPSSDNSSEGKKEEKTDSKIKAETIDDLVKLGLLEEIKKDGKIVGWESNAGLFYGMGSKEGNRVKHVFEHLKPNPNKPIHSVFDTDKAGLIVLIDEAWNKRADAYTKAQSNGNRIYDVDMVRKIGTNGEHIIRIVVRDNSEKIITAYPKK